MHVDLDGAWPRDILRGAAYADCREQGPALRFSATKRGIETFHAFARTFEADFVLFGSGDYHHLSALWLRRFHSPVTLVSFDNHPDWDVRPPYWCCGTWINRALELTSVSRAVIWGCGNFELNWPNSLFANHRARRQGRLEVWPWTERLNEKARSRWPGMQAADWREKFSQFAQSLSGADVYVTVDLDCLRRQDSITNWENGLFEAQDVAWALHELRRHASIVGGDVCGAYSPPSYARLKQRIESTLDHPKLSAPDMAEAQKVNSASLRTIWPALTSGDQ